MTSGDVTLSEIQQIIGDVLQLGDRTHDLSADSALLGGIPEFDSMAVVSVITAIEDNYGIVIDDEDITAEIFETVGDLHQFVLSQL